MRTLYYPCNFSIKTVLKLKNLFKYNKNHPTIGSNFSFRFKNTLKQAEVHVCPVLP